MAANSKASIKRPAIRMSRKANHHASTIDAAPTASGRLKRGAKLDRGGTLGREGTRDRDVRPRRGTPRDGRFPRAVRRI